MITTLIPSGRLKKVGRKSKCTFDTKKRMTNDCIISIFLYDQEWSEFSLKMKSKRKKIKNNMVVKMGAKKMDVSPQQ